jgi:hypothetical protein
MTALAADIPYRSRRVRAWTSDRPRSGFSSSRAARQLPDRVVRLEVPIAEPVPPSRDRRLPAMLCAWLRRTSLTQASLGLRCWHPSCCSACLPCGRSSRRLSVSGGAGSGPPSSLDPSPASVGWPSVVDNRPACRCRSPARLPALHDVQSHLISRLLINVAIWWYRPTGTRWIPSNTPDC